MAREDREAELARLAVLSDDEIDTIDIPEAPAENWVHAVRPYRPVKRPVTLRLDTDIVAWFKAHVSEGGYQTEINRVLRRYVAGAQGAAKHEAAPR